MKKIFFIFLFLLIPGFSFAKDLNFGDIKVKDIQDEKGVPEITITKWNKINYSIKAKDSSLQYETYNIPNIGYEYAIKLLKIPQNNIFSFYIDTSQINYYYQPSLSENEIEEGSIRPDNIIGSYALYTKSPLVSYSVYQDYGVNKIGHIFRPKIIDFKGDWIWGELNISNDTLTITIPFNFLQKAKYPVYVDPTFGFTSAGGSWQNNNQNRIVRSGDSFTASTGSVVSASIYVYTSPYTTNALLNMGYYASGSNYSILGGTSYTFDAGSLATGTWKTMSFPAAFAVSSSEPYYLAWSAFSANTYTAYDTGSSSNAAYYFSSFDNWKATTTWNNYAVARIYSLYITYNTTSPQYCTTTPPGGGVNNSVAYLLQASIIILGLILIRFSDFLRRFFKNQ